MALGAAGVAALLLATVFTGITGDTNCDDGKRFLFPSMLSSSLN